MQLCNTDSSAHDFYDDDDYNDQPDLVTLQNNNDNSILTFRAGGTDDTDTEGPVSQCKSMQNKDWDAKLGVQSLPFEDLKRSTLNFAPG